MQESGVFLRRGGMVPVTKAGVVPFALMCFRNQSGFWVESINAVCEGSTTTEGTGRAEGSRPTEGTGVGKAEGDGQDNFSDTANTTTTSQMPHNRTKAWAACLTRKSTPFARRARLTF
eukprot:1892776-Rhodomonas_salina.2